MLELIDHIYVIPLPNAGEVHAYIGLEVKIHDIVVSQYYSPTSPDSLFPRDVKESLYTRERVNYIPMHASLRKTA